MTIYWPVVLEQGLKELLRNGASLEIECIKSVARASALNPVGKWHVFARRHDGIEPARSQLVMQRNIEPRVFKSANGLIGFAMDLGCRHIDIPFFEGDVGDCGQSEMLMAEGPQQAE